MVKKKGKSKRETLGHKYKVKRKIKEHNRKLRRAVRKNPEMARKKLKRDPGIPNLFPLKEAMLGRMLKESAKMEAIEERQRNDRKNMLERRRNHNRDKAEQESTQSKVWQASASKEKKRQSWFVKDLKKVLEVSDVVLQVLDARDPMGCRCRRIEKLILGKLSENSPKPKRIILVLNKIDLAPPEVVEQWVRYLKRELPVVAFKSSTQKQGSNLGNSGNFDMHFSKGKAANSAALLQSSKCVGSSALMQLLKNYCRNLDLKTAITVGVIGYPNVGKSSVINSLKRQRVAGVGAQPGFTKQCQMVKLDKLISLVDSPGVLFEADSSDPGVMLRNCLKVEEIEDPLIAVEAIVARASKTKLLEIYQIGDFGGYEEFLLLVARKRGKLGKKGVADLPAAARCVLRDWNAGKIPFYCKPPAVDERELKAEQDGPQVGSFGFVNGWGAEFDVNALEASNRAVFTELKSSTPSGAREDFVEMDTTMARAAAEKGRPGEGGAGPASMEDGNDDDDDEEEEGDGWDAQRKAKTPNDYLMEGSKKKKKKKGGEAPLSLKKQQKLARKLKAKQQRRDDRTKQAAAKHQDQLQQQQQQEEQPAAAESGEAYTFDDDMWE